MHFTMHGTLRDGNKEFMNTYWERSSVNNIEIIELNLCAIGKWRLFKGCFFI